MFAIKKISIENFRQFDKLKINEVKRVNFLIGKNSCGKTTVLEALFWATTPQNMGVFSKVYAYRNIELNQDLLRTLFYRNHEDMKISVDIDAEEGRHFGFSMVLSKNNDRAMEIKYNNEVPNQTSPDKIYDYFTRTNSTNVIANSEYKMIATTDRIYLEELSDKNDAIKNNNLQNMTDKRVLDNHTNFVNSIVFNLTVSYYSDKITDFFVSSSINSLIIDSKEDKLLKYLKIFDSRVSGIGFDIDKRILIELEEDNEKFKLPLNLMGYGFCKFLSVVSRLLDNKTPIDVILIDEIENGLHYTNIKQLLKEILKLSKEMNIQMFITTHNYEVLKYLSEIMQEDDFNSQKDDVGIIKLSDVGGEYRALNRSIEDLESFIETEIR